MRHYINILLLTLCFGLTSCIYDKGIDFGPEHGADGYTFVFTLKVDGATSTSRADYATWGDTYDTDVTNYDAVINTDDIHVAIFDTKGTKVVDADKQLSCVQISPGTYQYYGKLDNPLTDGEKYRCMVVANNGGETVDFDNIETLTYKAADLPQADDTKDYFIPMWGVQEFTFEKDNDGQDLGTIYMLHSAAKCRVHLSDELSKDLQITSVKFTYLTPTGYVVPTGYNKVSATTALSYVDCFNPAPTVEASVPKIDADGNLELDEYGNPTYVDNFTTLNFISENDAKTSSVGYLTEFSTKETKLANLIITIYDTDKKTASDYSVALQFDENTNMTRNHVYDLEITNVVHGMTITIYTYMWDGLFKSYTTEFTDQITLEDDPISWSSYRTIDTVNHIVTLSDTNDLLATIKIYTPQSGKWLASLTPVDDEDTTNAIVFDTGESDDTSSEGVTYVSGNIDGVNAVELKIKAATKNNSIQHKSKLTVYVRFASGKTQVIEKASVWTIVQTK